MAKDKTKNKAEETVSPQAAKSTQVQKVLSMLDDGARFKNCNPDDLKKLTQHSVHDLFNTADGRRLLHPIPNKITVIKGDGSETQMPVFTNQELAMAGTILSNDKGEPILHVKDIKRKTYVPIEDMKTPEDGSALSEHYGTHATPVLELPKVDPKSQDGETVLISAKEAWQQWNRGQNKKKKKASSKSGEANDPIAFCNQKIAEAQTPEEKAQWEERLKLFTSKAA